MVNPLTNVNHFEFIMSGYPKGGGWKCYRGRTSTDTEDFFSRKVDDEQNVADVGTKQWMASGCGDFLGTFCEQIQRTITDTEEIID